MKYTFVEYAERRERVDFLIESVNAEARANPELERILAEAGFWGNLVQAGKKFVQGAWNQGGIAAGAQAAWSQMTGPETQVGYAITALQKTLKALENDPNWKNSMTTGESGRLPAMNLVVWLKDTIKELESQKPQFKNKELQNKNVAGPQTTAAQPATGVPAGNAPSKFS